VSVHVSEQYLAPRTLVLTHVELVTLPRGAKPLFHSTLAGVDRCSGSGRWLLTFPGHNLRMSTLMPLCHGHSSSGMRDVSYTNPPTFYLPLPHSRPCNAPTLPHSSFSKEVDFIPGPVRRCYLWNVPASCFPSYTEWCSELRNVSKY
jgi:hypothetical protein